MDGLPNHLSTSLFQSVSRAMETAIQDPVVYASWDLISVKAAAVRCCVDDAISSVLSARNLPPKYVAVWSLVWAHFPVTDLLVVSHVCREWRAHLLDMPALWSHLEVLARGRDEPDPELIAVGDASTSSNLHFLLHILPRSNHVDIKLEVYIETEATSEKFNDDLRSFLMLVAPRLSVLRILTLNPKLPVELFTTHQWRFPRLRSLALLSDLPELDDICNGLTDSFPFDCRRVSLPSLVHLKVHANFRLAFSAPYPQLRRLSCAVHRMKDAAALILSSPALDSLVVRCPADPFDVDTVPQHAQLVNRLDTISDVYLNTPRGAASEERVLRVLANVPRRRLVIDFDCSVTSNNIPFFPQSCTTLTSATHLAISRRPDRAVAIRASDAAHPERLMQITLTNPQWRHQTETAALTVDWARIASLPNLVALTVDARIWSAVTINFPRTPQLAQVTLKLADTADFGTLLAARPIPRLPVGVPLAIDSAVPLGIATELLHPVKQALGAQNITII